MKTTKAQRDHLREIVVHCEPDVRETLALLDDADAAEELGRDNARLRGLLRLALKYIGDEPPTTPNVGSIRVASMSQARRVWAQLHGELIDALGGVAR